jgi:Virulence factor
VTKVRILYWQDVPSVVEAVGDDGALVKRQLPDWYQQEIDRRAMDQGLIGSDAYLEQWRWEDAEERSGAPNDVLDELERELEAARSG